MDALVLLQSANVKKVGLMSQPDQATAAGRSLMRETRADTAQAIVLALLLHALLFGADVRRPAVDAQHRAGVGGRLAGLGRADRRQRTVAGDAAARCASAPSRCRTCRRRNREDAAPLPQPLPEPRAARMPSRRRSRRRRTSSRCPTTTNQEAVVDQPTPTPAEEEQGAGSQAPPGAGRPDRAEAPAGSRAAAAPGRAAWSRSASSKLDEIRAAARAGRARGQRWPSSACSQIADARARSPPPKRGRRRSERQSAAGQQRRR